MDTISYRWSTAGEDYPVRFFHVPGTSGRPYTFGTVDADCDVEVREFFIAATPVTQALWTHTMPNDSNPAVNRGADLPVENVSWDHITEPSGFLDRINQSPLRAAMLSQNAARGGEFRLPTETEWEYAARGGPHWRDGFS